MACSPEITARFAVDTVATITARTARAGVAARTAVAFPDARATGPTVATCAARISTGPRFARADAVNAVGTRPALAACPASAAGTLDPIPAEQGGAPSPRPTDPTDAAITAGAGADADAIWKVRSEAFPADAPLAANSAGATPSASAEKSESACIAAGPTVVAGNTGVTCAAGLDGWSPVFSRSARTAGATSAEEQPPGTTFATPAVVDGDHPGATGAAPSEPTSRAAVAAVVAGSSGAD